MIRVKRVYEAPVKEDGRRVLVDRLWPRGQRKETARVDEWLKDVAPSDALRKWFDHRPERWAEFQKGYWAELAGKDKQPLVERLLALGKQGTVTLLFAAKDEAHNNAVALKALLESRTKPR